jgi:hypothetical protein
MEIKFEVKYSFNTARQKYQAQIIIYLPKEDDNKEVIHHLLRCNKVQIFGEALISNWGWNDKDNKLMKHSAKELEDDNIVDLVKQIHELIDNSVATLRLVYKNNKELIKKIPSSCVYTYEIGD